MKLTKEQRRVIRDLFDGHCAYCGCDLGEKWHADHVEPVLRDGSFVLKPGAHFATWKCNGKMRAEHNDHLGNFFPACIKCNVLKSSGTVEDLRRTLSYFAESTPRISGYSHVHHLMRFGKLFIDPEPVVFYFERVQAQRSVDGADMLAGKER